MIYVDRAKAAAPAILTDAALKNGGCAETERAIAFYRKKTNREKSFPFKVYGDDSVRDALQELFRGKCAYCESRYEHIIPMEVEHWRPKGEVKEAGGKKIRPGYYWLAANWDNLFPACVDCNRRRYHKINVRGEEILLGKQNIFPIEIGSTRADRPGTEAQEKPLLLNPCKDQPCDYLTFLDPEGKIDDLSRRGLIWPQPKVTPKKRAKAEASIETYALQRPKLIEERKGKVTLILGLIISLRNALQRVQRRPNPYLADDEKDLDHQLKMLRQNLAETEPYLLLAREYIGPFLRDLKVFPHKQGSGKKSPRAGRSARRRPEKRGARNAARS